MPPCRGPQKPPPQQGAGGGTAFDRLNVKIRKVIKKNLAKSKNGIYIELMKTHEKFKTEKALTNYIIRLLKDYDGKVLAYKRHGGFGNESGKPDITGVAYGNRIEFEVKDPTRMSTDMTDSVIAFESACCGSLQRHSKLSLIPNREFNLLHYSQPDLTLLASKIQQVWIRRFCSAGASALVVCSPFQVAVKCEAIRRSKYSDMRLRLQSQESTLQDTYPIGRDGHCYMRGLARLPQ